MSVIDLLKSPLAIGGIVGTLAIGGGLTVYVVKEGGTSNDGAAFPSIFYVKTESFVSANNSHYNKDGSLKSGFTPGSNGHVSATELHLCELDANRATGCTYELMGATQITLRRHDLDPSRVVISGKRFGETLGPTSYTLDVFSKGISFANSMVQIVNWPGKEKNGK